jgi:recombinational DNA repair ATPase RecF
MIIKELDMENFRSYGNASITFSPGQNYFFGRNWQGKSSIMVAGKPARLLGGFCVSGASLLRLVDQINAGIAPRKHKS